MKVLKILVLLHLILGPIGYFIMAEDARHPETWDTWYRNPSIAVPFCIVAEIFIWGSVIYVASMERGMEEGSKTILAEVVRLQNAGEHEAAAELYDQWLRALGQKPKGG